MPHRSLTSVSNHIAYVNPQRRLQRQLLESKSSFRSLFTQAAVGFAYLSLGGRFQLVNQRFAEILGRTREQLQACIFQEITHPADLNKHLAMAQRLLADEIENDSIETRCLLPNRTQVWVNLTASLMRDPKGEPLWFVVVAENIQTRKQAEQKLHESETKFHTLANLIPQPAWIASAGGHVQWCNDRWHEYTGTTPEQMQGRGWESVHHPDELPTIHEKWKSATANGLPFDMPLHIRGANGLFRKFLVRVEPLRDPQGKVSNWLGTHTDAEATKRAEENPPQIDSESKYRAGERTAQLESSNREWRHGHAEIQRIFESLPGSYLVFTPDLKLVHVSDAYLEATLTSRDGILGRNLFDVLSDIYRNTNAAGVSNLSASLDRVQRSAKPDTMSIQTYPIRRPDGTIDERYWSVLNSPVFGANHRIQYIVHRVEDVTEFMLRKKHPAGTNGALHDCMDLSEAEVYRNSQELQETNLQLESSNRELESFSYSVSHDLRAPLRGVAGYVRMLKEDFADQLDSEGVRMLNVISEETGRMSRLIDELLNFSRLGGQTLAHTQVDMTDLAATAFREATASSQVVPSFKLMPLPMAIGDRSMLRQVFANLIGNAIKFSSVRAAPLIEIGGELTSEGNFYHVSDNGVGFDEQYRHKLFVVFQRLHTKSEFEGTGVGLALAHRIIVRHGGRIWATGRPNDGATFSFMLPNQVISTKL